jgi:ribosomal protein S18 acetylase RimI-like enzyme
MNSLILPIPYREEFYKEIMEDPVTASITRLALWHDKPDLKPPNQVSPGRLVAAVRCRIFPTPPDNPYEKTPVLYIATITTLAPFRGHALASHLLAEVTATAIEKYGVKAVMAHVWEENEDGMKWYKKRGFRVIAHEPQYYRRLAPKTAAHVIRRDVGPGDLLQNLDVHNDSSQT